MENKDEVVLKIETTKKGVKTIKLDKARFQMLENNPGEIIFILIEQ